MIKVKSLTKEYFKGETLFKNVDFVVSKNDKVGLIGPNGCGKSTLLKIIAGIEEKTDGAILVENEQIGYLPQEFDLPKDQMIGEYLGNLRNNLEEFYMIDIVLTQLEFVNVNEYELIKNLSEGQKMKLKLCELLVLNPTTLILDEPTNHLDIDGILWFEEFVKNFKGNVLMISHDRSFLNNTVNKIFEIENKEFHIFTGNYDDYMEQKNQFLEKREEEYTRFLRKKKQLEDLLALAHKIGGKRNVVQAAKSRFDREITKLNLEKYEIKKIKDLSLGGEVNKHKLIIQAIDVKKGFTRSLSEQSELNEIGSPKRSIGGGTKEVLKNVNFEVRGHEKVWLYGPNGIGKSTLVKVIMKTYDADSGELKLGNNLRIGYFAQVNEILDTNLNVLEYFEKESGLAYNRLFGVLEKFLFPKDVLSKKIKMLSPGERARLKLALFTLKDYELLILDEPTNHLDILAKQVIEQALREFKGTLLLVSHDRYFVSEVGVSKILHLKEGCIETQLL